MEVVKYVVPNGGLIKLLRAKPADIPMILWGILKPNIRALADVVGRIAGKMLKIQLIARFNVTEDDADLVVGTKTVEGILPQGAQLVDVMMADPPEMPMKLWTLIKPKIKMAAALIDRLGKKIIVRYLVDRFKVAVTDAAELVSLLPNLVDLLETKPADLPQKLLDYAKNAAVAVAKKAIKIASRMLQALCTQFLLDKFLIPLADAKEIVTKLLDTSEIVNAISVDVAALPMQLFEIFKGKVAAFKEDKSLQAVITRSIRSVIARMLVDQVQFKQETAFILVGFIPSVQVIVDAIADPSTLPMALWKICQTEGAKALGALFRAAREAGGVMLETMKREAIRMVTDILVNKLGLKPEIAEELAGILNDIQEAFMESMMESMKKMNLTSALGGVAGGGESGGAEVGGGGASALSAITSSSESGSASTIKGMDALQGSIDSSLAAITAIVARRRVLEETAGVRPADSADDHPDAEDVDDAGGVIMLSDGQKFNPMDVMKTADEAKNKVIKQLNSTLNTVITLVDGVVEKADSFLEKTSSTVNRALTDLKAKANGVVTMIESKVMEGIDFLQKTVNTVLTKVRNILGTIEKVARGGLTLITNVVEKGINTVGNLVMGLIQTANDTANMVISYIGKAKGLLQLVNVTAHKGFAFAKGLIEKVQTFATNIFATIDGIIDKVFKAGDDAMKKADQIIAGIMEVLKLMKLFASLLGKIMALYKKYGSVSGVLKAGLKAGAQFAVKYAVAEAKARATGQPNEMLQQLPAGYGPFTPRAWAQDLSDRMVKTGMSFMKKGLDAMGIKIPCAALFSAIWTKIGPMIKKAVKNRANKPAEAPAPASVQLANTQKQDATGDGTVPDLPVRPDDPIEKMVPTFEAYDYKGYQKDVPQGDDPDNGPGPKSDWKGWLAETNELTVDRRAPPHLDSDSHLPPTKVHE